jgi:hypothetical protein
VGYRAVRTENGLAISLGNTGLGKVPSFSTNRTTCGDLSKYCSKYCYMNYSSRIFKAVKKCQDTNTVLLQTWSQEKTVSEIDTFIKKYQFPLFRIHVNGDFLDRKELDSWIQIAQVNPATKFLAFTKQVHLFNLISIPDNLKIRFSVFFNMPETVKETILDKGFPIAYTDMNNVFNSKVCSKPCETCQFCYNSTENVFLPLHGKRAILSFNKEKRESKHE